MEHPRDALSTQFRRGLSCALAFSLLTTIWLMMVVGQSASSSRRDSAGLIPLMQQVVSLEREVLRARLNFVYYATIQKPGSLDAGWVSFHEVERLLGELDHELEHDPEAVLLEPRVDGINTDWATYQAQLEEVLRVVSTGTRSGPEYNEEISEWAADGNRLVNSIRDVEDNIASLLKAQGQNTSFMLRLSLWVIGINGMVWSALALTVLLSKRSAIRQAAAAWRAPRLQGLLPWFRRREADRRRSSLPAGQLIRRLAIRTLAARAAESIRDLGKEEQRLRTYAVWALMLVAVTIVLGTGLFALHSITALSSEQDWVLHSEQVLADASSLRSAMLSVESDTRGFAFSGRNIQLIAAEAGVRGVRRQWDRLYAETADNPAQQARLRGVDAAMEQRLDSLRRIIEARQAGGPEAVQNLVGTGQTLALKYRLEERLEGFESAEHGLLIERKLLAERRATISRALIIFAALPAALGLAVLGIVTAWSLRRYMGLKERMSYLAHHDALTGLPNRLQLDHCFEAMFAEARKKQTQFAVLGIDLDRFKQINDQYGHEAGDLFLKAVAGRLSSVLRRGDTLLRIGGDEFLCLIDSLKEKSDAGVVAEKLLGSLAEAIVIHGVPLQASASIGIAVYGGVGEPCEELKRSADMALYRAKAAGRGTYRFADEGLSPCAAGGNNLSGSSMVPA